MYATIDQPRHRRDAEAAQESVSGDWGDDRARRCGHGGLDRVVVWALSGETRAATIPRMLPLSPS